MWGKNRHRESSQEVQHSTNGSYKKRRSREERIRMNPVYQK